MPCPTTVAASAIGRSGMSTVEGPVDRGVVGRMGPSVQKQAMSMRLVSREPPWRLCN